MSIPSNDPGVPADRKPGLFARMRAALKRPGAKVSLILVPVAFFLGGIVFWGGFNWGMEMTNTLEFCTGCHEMKDNAFSEYKDTIHYSNRTGIRAKCSDCHVPHEWGPKLVRKVQATKEVWGKLTGYIDTKEKFEAHRMAMATHEWNRMKANNSQECRNCHSFEAMSKDLQKATPYRKHMEGRKAGKTCIDCHKGIAHALPKEYKDPEEE